MCVAVACGARLSCSTEQNRTEFIAQTMHNTRYGALANACIQIHTHTHTHIHTHTYIYITIYIMYRDEVHDLYISIMIVDGTHIYICN